ncbi:MAG: hypothetical protein ACK5MD_05665 [Flavobacteriales bacterium]
MDRLRKRVLLSAQRALLGEIYPEIRGICVGFSNKLLHIIFYMDRTPIESDYDTISSVSGEIISDFKFPEEFDRVQEDCVFSNDPITNLNSLDDWVYIRKENGNA